MEPISEIERPLLEELKKTMADANLSPIYLQDKNMIRWLRARNCKVSKSEEMLRKHLQWKIDEDIKGLRTWTPPEFVVNSIPWSITGFTREGCPIVNFPIGEIDLIKIVNDGYSYDMVRYCIYCLQSMINYLLRLSKGSDYVIPVFIIVDLKGLSYSTVTHKGVVDAVLQMVKHFEANFPELLRSVMIINAPWVFSIAWAIMKVFISDRTQNKLCFLGGDMTAWRARLLEFGEPDQFSQCYGGDKLDSEWYRITLSGEPVRMINGNPEEQTTF